MRTLLAGLAMAWLCAAQTPRCDLAPGWSRQGAARSYEASNLFEYMDGNAEGYLLYGFVAMHGVTCAHGGDTLVIDVSEFADGDSAFGMFSANRDPRLPLEPLGASGQVTARRVIFTRGPFYAELAASPDKDHTATLRAFSAALEKLLPGSTARPAALDWFPLDGQKSVRLIPESVLGLRLLKRGYVAEYEFGKAFIVQESSAEDAAVVMQKLRVRLSAATDSDGGTALQVTDKYLGRVGATQRGPYIVGYANVAEGHDPMALASALAARLP